MLGWPWKGVFLGELGENGMLWDHAARGTEDGNDGGDRVEG